MTPEGSPNYSTMAAAFNLAFKKQVDLVQCQGSCLGMTNVTRLQEFDHKLNQSKCQRDARNVSDALTYSLQRAACPAAGQTPGLVPSNSDQGQQAMLAAFVNQMQVQAEAKVQRASRPSGYFLSSKQGQQLRKPLPGCNSLLQLADTMASLMLQPGLTTQAVAIHLLYVGLANSQELGIPRVAARHTA